MASSTTTDGRVAVPRRAGSRTIGYGLAALATALAAMAFAWDGGLLLAPLAIGCAVAAVRTSRGRSTGTARVGVGLAVAAVLLTLVAFSSSGGLQPALRTDASSYAPGGVVHADLRNGLQPAGSDRCWASALQHRDAGQWVSVQGRANTETFPSALTACDPAPSELLPFTGADGVVELPSGLASGEYRLAMRLHVAGATRWVESEPFTVG